MNLHGWWKMFKIFDLYSKKYCGLMSLLTSFLKLFGNNFQFLEINDYVTLYSTNLKSETKAV